MQTSPTQTHGFSYTYVFSANYTCLVFGLYWIKQLYQKKIKFPIAICFPIISRESKFTINQTKAARISFWRAAKLKNMI